MPSAGKSSIVSACVGAGRVALSGRATRAPAQAAGCRRGCCRRACCSAPRWCAWGSTSRRWTTRTWLSARVTRRTTTAGRCRSSTAPGARDGRLHRRRSTPTSWRWPTASGGQGRVPAVINLVMGLGTRASRPRARSARPFPRRLATFLGALHRPGLLRVVARQDLPGPAAHRASFWLVTLALRGGRARRWLLAGLAVGLAALAHSTLLVLLPAVASTWPRSRPSLVRRPQALARFAAGFLLGVAPATAAQLPPGRGLRPDRLPRWVTFHLGNSGYNRTGAMPRPVRESNADSEEFDFKREAERRTGRALSPPRVSRYWLRQGLSDIRATPGSSLQRDLAPAALDARRRGG